VWHGSSARKLIVVCAVSFVACHFFSLSFYDSPILVLFCVDFVLNSCLWKRFWELRKWLETHTKGKLAIALLH
jgi:hypothetical protein